MDTKCLVVEMGDVISTPPPIPKPYQGDMARGGGACCGCLLVKKIDRETCVDDRLLCVGLAPCLQIMAS